MPKVGIYTQSDADADIAVHAADLDAHIHALMQEIRTGEYFLPVPIYTSITRTLTADRMSVHLFIVPRDLTIDRLAIDVVTADAGKIARLGIYRNGANLYPGALVKDYGTVSVNATGVVAASADQSLTKGLYWLAFVSDGTPKVKGKYPSCSPLGNTATNFDHFNLLSRWYKEAVGSGALADPFISDASVSSGAYIIIMPRLKSLD